MLTMGQSGFNKSFPVTNHPSYSPWVKQNTPGMADEHSSTTFSKHFFLKSSGQKSTQVHKDRDLGKFLQ